MGTAGIQQKPLEIVICLRLRRGKANCLAVVHGGLVEASGRASNTTRL